MTETFPEGEETAGWIVKLAEEIASTCRDGVDPDDAEDIAMLACTIRGAVERGSADPIVRALNNENQRMRDVMEDIRVQLSREVT